MDFLKKIFSSKSKTYDKLKETHQDTKTDFMSEDERFVYNFIKNGGQFFYPEDMEQFKSGLLKLLKHLEISNYHVLERSYYHFLKKINIPVEFGFTKQGVLLGGCESLIAHDGAIMTTEKHTSNYRNPDLPHRRVIVALSSQITPTKSQALSNINKKYETLPSNIQTMSIFAKPKDALQGGNWFEVYLFLIEN